VFAPSPSARDLLEQLGGEPALAREEAAAVADLLRVERPVGRRERSVCGVERRPPRRCKGVEGDGVR